MREHAPWAWGSVFAVVASKLALHLHASAVATYGYFADELYYLACARSLAWGYVDHPPLSVWLLRAVTETLGTSLFAIELLPALAGAATLVGIAGLARALGGGQAAQLCAATAGLASLAYLVTGSFHSMNAYEPLLWVAGYALLLRILRTGKLMNWIALGSVVGLGLLNKYSMGLFAIGLGVGLLVTPARRLLRTPGPWLAGAVAALIFGPNAVWLLRHDFITLEFLAAMRESSSDAVSPGAFAAGQVLAMSPLVTPLWLAGLGYGLFSRELREVRAAFWIFVVALGLLAASGSAQPYYPAPAYPLVLAAGAVALERFAEARRRHWLPAAATAGIVLGAAPLVPLALPLLPADALAAYVRAFSGDERAEQNAFDSELPGHLALRFGWPELASAVAHARDALPPEERSGFAVLAPSFGEAAALDFFGPGLGLPGAIGTHNQYGLWGPGASDGALLLVVADEDEPRIAHQDRPPGFRRGETPRELARLCGGLERLVIVECRFCAPYVSRKAVWACRGLRRPLSEVWSDLWDVL
jgi:hypothetical protein